MHEAWHVVVLALTLLGAASGVIVLIAPLVFELPPADLARVRPLLLALVALATLLLLVEWLAVHGGSV